MTLFHWEGLWDIPLHSLDGFCLTERVWHQCLSFLASNRSPCSPIRISFLWYYFPGRDQEKKTVSISNSESSVSYNFSKFCYSLCGLFSGVTFLLLFLSKKPKRSQLSLSAFSPAWYMSLLRVPACFPHHCRLQNCETPCYLINLQQHFLHFHSSPLQYFLDVFATFMRHFYCAPSALDYHWAPRPTANALLYYSSFTLPDSNSVLVAVR